MIVYIIATAVTVISFFAYYYVWTEILGLYPPMPFIGYLTGSFSLYSIYATLWFRLVMSKFGDFWKCMVLGFLNSDRKWIRQDKWPFRTISGHFLPTVFSFFTKLRFRRSFWGAKQLVQMLWHKMQIISFPLFLQFCRLV
jgi:hypothetical protein